jgi:TPR repeat protein/serine/threonine protein kinase
MIQDGNGDGRDSAAPQSLGWGKRGIASIGMGDVVGGHYVIEDVLDEGGMAVVFRARNAATGRQCALKVLQAQLSARPEFIRLFAKEAKIGSVIGDHKHIVRVFDAGLDEERRAPFIVMELLEGETLERALEGGPLPRRVVRAIMSQLGDALEQAHRAGVVHRDLKPGNLFLTSDEDGEALLKVMDFGIAKILEGGVVRTATQVGTPAYTAPEQMGATTRKIAARQGIKIAAGVSPATDVWAIGLLAYEIFGGLPPGHYWGAETLSELPMKVAFEQLEAASRRAGDAASRLPLGFDAWFARCMHKDADERWATAGEAIRELLRLEDPLAAPPPLPQPKLPPPRAPSPPRPAAAAPASARPRARHEDEDSARMATESDADEADVADSFRTRVRSERPRARERDADDDAGLPSVGASTITVAARGASKTEVPQRAADKKLAQSSDAPVEVPKSRSSAARRERSVERPRRPNNTASYALGGAAVVALGVTGWLAYSQRSTSSAEQSCLRAEQLEDRSLAASSCDRACDTGSLASCARLATHYETGDGVKADEERARALHAKACGVAEMVPGGRKGGGSGDAARRWTTAIEGEGCEDKKCISESCAALAGYYESGRGGVPSSERIATALFKRVCDVDFAGDETPRGVAGCVGLARQREVAGQQDAARNYFNAACNGDVLEGCVGLATILERGDQHGQGRDEKTARTLYQRACDGANLAGCTRLGHMVGRGKGGWVRDEPASVKLFKRACDGGELQGCTALGSAYLSGRGGLPKDMVRAAELFRSSCEANEMVGCAQLASLTADGQGGITKDEKQAYKLNKQACDAGALLGCANLGGMYNAGQAGLTKDAREGRQLIDKACKGGEPVGCYRLAQLEAVEGKLLGHELEALFQKACDDGEPRACSALGELFERGESGITQDYERAATLYKRACDEGAMRGCTNLANLAYQGLGGLERDPAQSVSLNDQACKGGDSIGCARLGVLYALGQGVTKDRTRAAQLYDEACTRGSDKSDEMKSRCEMLQKMIASEGEEETPGGEQKTNSG